MPDLALIACLILVLFVGIGGATTASLRSLGDELGLYVGTAVGVAHLGDVEYAVMAAEEYSIWTPENCMKWKYTEPEPGAFNFTDGDELMELADVANASVRGHNLVWHSELPPYLCAEWHDKTICNRTDLSVPQLYSALKQHVQTVAGRWAGSKSLRAWDVVNEAVEDGGEHNVWLDLWSAAFGDMYVAWAFEWAHYALAARGRDDVKLFYNDYGIHSLCGKSDGVYRLLRKVLAQGVRVDGLGVQMHVTVDDPPQPLALTLPRSEPFAGSANMTLNFKRFIDLGLDIHITEMDVSIASCLATEPSDVCLDKQAAIYQQVLDVCLSLLPHCKAFVSWGFTDRFTWLGAGAEPLPFDVHYSPKPAFFSIRDTLLNATSLRT